MEKRTRRVWQSISAAPSPTSASSGTASGPASKVLTTPRAPEEGVLTGIAEILKLSGVKPADLGLIIHGTTLATNAIIERKGAKTALVVTEGFRDSIEMAFEHRFEQYDIFMRKPPPLVARELRFGVPERLDGRGNVLVPLDEAAVRGAGAQARGGRHRGDRHRLHARLSRRHARAAHARHPGRPLPGVSISLSSEVSPEIREYERWSTAAANAYVQPVMDRYLGRLDAGAAQPGLRLPAVHDHLGRRPGQRWRRRASSRSGWSNPARPAAPSWPPRWPASAASTRCCRSTWAARPPRSA